MQRGAPILVLKPRRAERATDAHGLLFELLRPPQEQDELLEARGVVDDLREVAGELRGAENVVEVLLPRARARLAQHAHGLRGLTHRGVDAARGQRQEDLADAEDELREVESAQDVLRQDLPVHHQAEGLLRRGRGVVVVHQRRRHFNEVRARQRRDHAHGVAVHTAADGHHHDVLACALRGGDGLEQLWLPVGVGALEAFARGVREVVPRATLGLERREDVGPVAEGVAGLADGDDGEEGLAVVGAEERREATDAGNVLPLVRDHWQVEAANLKWRRLLLGQRLRLERPPSRDGPVKGVVGEGTEDGGDGAPAHALRLRGVILEEPGDRPEADQWVHALGNRGDEGDLHAAEGEHAQDGGDGQLRAAALGRDEEEQARAIGAVQDHVAGDAEEGLVLADEVVGPEGRPSVEDGPLRQSAGAAHDRLGIRLGALAGGGDDVEGGELRGALRQGCFGQQDRRVRAAGLPGQVDVRDGGREQHGVRAGMEQRVRRDGSRLLDAVLEDSAGAVQPADQGVQGDCGALGCGVLGGHGLDLCPWE
mmetsp:Transcript_104239/g.300028  ORF Transcript_104239/g.300028 Transcript_104239/m.300028 type:complete len:540 (+) Transcript_104239:117-1736(+)